MPHDDNMAEQKFTDGLPHWCLVDVPHSPFHKWYVYARDEEMPAILAGEKEPSTVMSAQAGLDFLRYTVNLWFRQYENLPPHQELEPPEEIEPF